MYRWPVGIVFVMACRGEPSATSDNDDTAQCSPEVGNDGIDNDCDGAVDCEDTDLIDGERDEVQGVDLPTLCNGFCTLRIRNDVTFKAVTDRMSGGTLATGSTTIPGVTDLADMWCVTEIGGDFTVFANHGLRNLNGLQQLRSVGGFLVLDTVRNLDDLAGLEGLAEAGAVTIGGINNLSSLRGFGPTAMGDLQISGNPVLASLDGLGRARVSGSMYVLNNPILSSVQGPVLEKLSGDLVLYGNPSLRTLVGFERLRSLGGDLRIDNNRRLSDLSALSGLQKVGGDVTITNNPKLTDAQAQALVDGIGEIGGTVTISGNGG